MMFHSSATVSMVILACPLPLVVKVVLEGERCHN